MSDYSNGLKIWFNAIWNANNFTFQTFWLWYLVVIFDREVESDHAIILTLIFVRFLWITNLARLHARNFSKTLINFWNLINDYKLRLISAFKLN